MSSPWRQSANALEEVSLLPILQVTQGRHEAVHKTAPSATVYRAIVDMVKHRCGWLMVMKGADLAGIVTERDILEKLPLDLSASRSTLVSAIMTPSDSLITAPPTYTLDKCVGLMHSGVFRHLPVVDRQGELKSCVSMRDIAQLVSNAVVKKPLEYLLFGPSGAQDITIYYHLRKINNPLFKPYFHKVTNFPATFRQNSS